MRDFWGDAMTLLLQHRRLAVIVGTLLPAVVCAQTPEFEDWNAKLQATYVWQAKPPFAATAALGFRPWASGELYFDPEVVQGVPLSNLTGLGGFTNGEIARVTGPTPAFYRARLFLRQTWGMGGGREPMESDA